MATLTVRPLPINLINDPVNPVVLPGTASYTNGVLTITGSGEDIEDTADAFQFVHQPLVGDGQIVAHILSITGADALAEVGLMFRESLDSGLKPCVRPSEYAVGNIGFQTPPNERWVCRGIAAIFTDESDVVAVDAHGEHLLVAFTS